MGFFDKIFHHLDKDEEELDAARARHGIIVDKKEMDKPATEEERFASEYDAWEELKHFRSDFFMGKWARRKFTPIGEEKVKRQLEDLEKKRAAEAQQKQWDKWDKKGK
jgi:hypothetical protein